MNTNSNTYTIIYSIVLVVVVAAILAFVAEFLKPAQEKNVKLETITQVLTAAAQSDETVSIEEDTDVIKMYTDYIVDAFYANGLGVKGKSMNIGKEDANAIEVSTTSDLKKQNDIMKKIEAGDASQLENLELPVYVFDINGNKITVIPCYGAGLWGPIWGYVAVESDGKTIAGAIFDHKGETPGLGAEIATEPFYSMFPGKVFGEGNETFAVVKGGAKGATNAVDAISGATITCEALGKSINLWGKYYQPYLAANAEVTTETVERNDSLPAIEDLSGIEAVVDSLALVKTENK